MIIGFTAYNLKQAYENFKTFLQANADQVVTYDIPKGYAKLVDGDEIFIIFQTNKASMLRLYDQLIVSDDSRMMALEKLPNIRYTNNIPWEFKIIKDNIDEEVPDELS